MKNPLSILFISLSMLFCFSSCDKEPEPVWIENTNPKVPIIYNNLKKVSDFIQKNETKFQVFNLDASKGGNIISKNGIRYFIPANAFVNSFGALVTGNITLSIKEILGVSDMVLSNKPTLTKDGKILESYGEFFVKAQQNNQNLRLRLDSGQLSAAIRISILNRNHQPTQIPLWEGDTTIVITKTGYNHENKYLTKTTEFPLSKGIDWKELLGKTAAGGMDSIRFELPELFKWANCDVLSNLSSSKTTVLCYFENIFNDEKGSSYQGIDASMCFFKPEGKNSVVKLYTTIIDAPKGKEGFLSYQNSMPVGVKGTFFVMVTKDEKFYCQSKSVTITAPEAGKDYTPIGFQLKEVTEKELLDAIKALNQ
jgi:hypothetical protein